MYKNCSAVVLWAAVLAVVGPIGALASDIDTGQSRAANIYWQLMKNNEQHFRYGASRVSTTTDTQVVTPRILPSADGSTHQTRPAPTRKVGATSASDLAGEESERSHAKPWWQVSEVRVGVLSHDIVFPDRNDFRAPNPFESDREDGVDINGEVLFTSPGFLELIFAPRPHLGVSINTSSETNSAYAGLTWDGRWDSGIFLEGFLGMAVHDGKLENANPERIEFGSRALFRLGGELGWRHKSGHGASLIWDHMSNAGLLSSKNQGIDNAGIRYSYRFK